MKGLKTMKIKLIALLSMAAATPIISSFLSADFRLQRVNGEYTGTMSFELPNELRVFYLPLDEKGKIDFTKPDWPEDKKESFINAATKQWKNNEESYMEIKSLMKNSSNGDLSVHKCKCTSIGGQSTSTQLGISSNGFGYGNEAEFLNIDKDLTPSKISEGWTEMKSCLEKSQHDKGSFDFITGSFDFITGWSIKAKNECLKNLKKDLES
jgi:hypothetical protein